MATWALSPQYKKSAIEKMFFFKEGKIIVMEQGFRWATFTVQSDERPLNDAELKNDDYYELGCIDNDESWEMNDMSDGCWCDITAGNDKTTSTDIEEFEAAWGEDWYSGVEALGWTQDETEYYYYGPLLLTNEDTGEVFKGEPDSETVEKLVEGYADFIENLTDEEWDNLGKDENPYTDWFPADINPVRVGTYQVLDTEQEIAWPFQSNIIAGTWDGEKWDISVSTTVIKWRGLAKDPNA
jgi:hypothetical protein